MHRHGTAPCRVRQNPLAHAGGRFAAAVSPRPRALGRTRPCAAQALGVVRESPFAPPQQRWVACRSSSGTSTDGSTQQSAPQATDERLKATLADLDALLGIEEEPAGDQGAKTVGGAGASAGADAANIALLQSAVAAEVQKLAGAQSDPKAAAEIERDMSDQMKKLVERAKEMTEDDGADRLGQKEALRQEFEQLLNLFFNGDSSLDRADIKRLRESGVFGPLTFWVTEVRNLEEQQGASQGAGVLIRGNLRADRQAVFRSLCDKVAELFGPKYEVLMVEDPEAAQDGEGGGGGGGAAPGRQAQGAGGRAAAAAAAQDPRVAFQVVPAAAVTPPPTGGWKVAVAGVLLLLLIASSVQLSLVANIAKLPKETLEYLANPDNLRGADDALPPGLAGWDPAPYLASAFPIAAGVVGLNLAHELGHRVAAWVRGVKLGPTYFIPNLQVGSFGGITPLKSLVRDRGELWDVAAAGPLAGVAASAAVLAVGLSQSHAGGLPQELLVPVPTQLFQGSLLLGSVTRLALGADAMSRAEVLISPLVIAGWCGLITNSLNLLPVGCLDGGRMVQSAFGAQALSLSAFFSYVGLGLGLLGSSLSLPFGLYVLICQRSAERYIRDSVTPVAGAKQTATAVAVLTAVLVLVPMAPEVAQSVGVGPSSPNLFM